MPDIYLADKEIRFIKTTKENASAETIFIEKGNLWPFWDYFAAFLKAEPGKVLMLGAEDDKWLFRYVATFFEPVEVAGGLVKNEQNKLLFIFRNDRWDLPKGHGDKGESIEQTAIREVMEETGVDGLKIIGSLPETYHVFENKNGQFAIKKTWWFFMKTSSKKELVPQLKEKITRAEWLAVDRLSEVFENTYGSVKQVINNYMKQYFSNL